LTDAEDPHNEDRKSLTHEKNRGNAFRSVPSVFFSRLSLRPSAKDFLYDRYSAAIYRRHGSLVTFLAPQSSGIIRSLRASVWFPIFNGTRSPGTINRSETIENGRRVPRTHRIPLYLIRASRSSIIDRGLLLISSSRARFDHGASRITS
jgi:hypothetical protein